MSEEFKKPKTITQFSHQEEEFSSEPDLDAAAIKLIADFEGEELVNAIKNKTIFPIYEATYYQVRNSAYIPDVVDVIELIEENLLDNIKHDGSFEYLFSDIEKSVFDELKQSFIKAVDDWSDKHNLNPNYYENPSNKITHYIVVTADDEFEEVQNPELLEGK